MKYLRKIDDTQDFARIAIGVVLLVAAPEFIVPLKIADIAIRSINRVLKVASNINDDIVHRQKIAFDKAWKRTQKDIKSDTQKKLSQQLQDFFEKELSTNNLNYVMQDECIEKIVSNKHRFDEWYAQNADIKEVAIVFTKHFSEEINHDTILREQINVQKPEAIKSGLLELDKKLNNIENRVSNLEEKQKEVSPQSHFLSSEDTINYHLWLKDYLEKASGLYTASRTVGYFNDVYTYIVNQIESKTWKQSVIEVIDRSQQLTKDLVALEILQSCLDFIRRNVSYDIIYQKIRELSHGLMDKDVLEVFDTVLERRYSKITFISGEPGSGKTHFIRACLSEIIDNDSIKIIMIPISNKYIETASFDFDIEVLVTKILANCFQLNINSLTHLNVSGNTRIAFIIDDIQRVFFGNKGKFERLLNGIAELTKYDYISWIITINEFDSYILDFEEGYINKYSTFYDMDEIKHNMLKYSINLTALNNFHSIGRHILQTYNKDVYPEYNISEAEDRIASCIDNPLYAHIMGQNCPDVIIPYEATYLGYIEKIALFVDSKLKLSNHETYDAVSDAIISVAEVSLNNGKVNYTSRELREICIETVIAILRTYNLVRYKGTITDLYSCDYNKDTYDLYTTIYWSFIIAARLTSSNKFSLDYMHSKIFDFVSLRHELLPCHLLFLDRNNLEREYQQMFYTLSARHFLHYALLCSVKASYIYSNNLRDYLIENSEVDFTNSETFSLLYYLYFASIKLCDKCSIISKYITVVSKVDMIFHFQMVIDSILEKITTAITLRRVIKPFFDIESKDANHMLGYDFGWRYYKLVIKDELDKQVRDIFMFLNENAELILKYIDTNTTFIDFFLRQYFELTIAEKGLVDLHDILSNYGYMYTTKSKLGLIIRRNFACAAGNVYERSHVRNYHRQYIDLLSNIINNGDEEGYKFAFHLISNSISKEDEHSYHVHNDFVPMLEIIWEEPALSHFVNDKDRIRFFSENLSEKTFANQT